MLAACLKSPLTWTHIGRKSVPYNLFAAMHFGGNKPQIASADLDNAVHTTNNMYLLDCALTDHVPSVPQDREAEASIQLLPSDGAHKLGIIAWLKIALGGHM
jgi:hypothetical protein